MLCIMTAEEARQEAKKNRPQDDKPSISPQVQGAEMYEYAIKRAQEHIQRAVEAGERRTKFIMGVQWREDWHIKVLNKVKQGLISLGYNVDLVFHNWGYTFEFLIEWGG